MAWITANLPTLLIVLGIGMLALEVGVLGFSVFVIFFIGLACIVTGILMLMGLLPGGVVVAFGSVALFSLAFAFALWKPLKRMQDSGITKGVQGDFIGHTLVLAQDISPTTLGSYRLSGVDWRLKSSTPLTAGTLVEVVKVEVGELTVAAKSA